MDFLKKHGEKILFLVLVAVLAVSVFFLLTANFQTDTGIGPGRRSQLSPLDTAALDKVLAHISGSPVQLPVATNAVTSGIRVTCINPDDRSLIPRGTLVCPYCGVTQTIKEITDADGDGLPDKWELQYGLDPQDPTDAHKDMDGDGFSNFEEYLAGTDPTDPASHPPLIDRLRLGEVVHVEIFVRLRGIARGPRSITLQLQWRYPGASRWEEGYVSTGNRFGRENEFLFEKFEEKRVERTPGRWTDESVAILRSGRHVLRLGEGGEDAVRESTATLILTNRPAWKEVVKVEHRFVLDKIEYMVVDIDKSSVVLRKATGGDPITVRAPTPEELAPKAPAAVPPRGRGAPLPVLPGQPPQWDPDVFGDPHAPADEEIF